MVECLTSAGCSLQASNKEGESPLYVAAVRGYYGIVRFLSENGAQLDLRDKVGVLIGSYPGFPQTHKTVHRFVCLWKAWVYEAMFVNCKWYLKPSSVDSQSQHCSIYISLSCLFVCWCVLN